MHTRYRVKGRDSACRTVEITQEVPGGYMVRLRCETAWNTSEAIEFMSGTLFRTCLRTGYLTAESETVTRAEKPSKRDSPGVELPA